MICNFDIQDLKPNSVLVTDDKGVVHCISISEFQKDFIAKNEEMEIKIKQVINSNNVLRQEILNMHKKIDVYSKAIYEFLNILKGINANEEKNE